MLYLKGNFFYFVDFLNMMVQDNVYDYFCYLMKIDICAFKNNIFAENLSSLLVLNELNKKDIEKMAVSLEILYLCWLLTIAILEALL